MIYLGLPLTTLTLNLLSTSLIEAANVGLFHRKLAAAQPAVPIPELPSFSLDL